MSLSLVSRALTVNSSARVLLRCGSASERLAFGAVTDYDRVIVIVSYLQRRVERTSRLPPGRDVMSS